MQLKSHYLFIVSSLLAAILALIMWLVVTGRADNFDFPLRNVLLALNSPNSVDVWKKITTLGSTRVIAGLSVLGCLTLILRKDWQAARYLSLIMIGASVIDIGLKWAIHRPRPLEVFPHTMPLSFSFPSGHALFSFTFYFSFVAIISPFLDRTTRVVVLALSISVVLLIGASRIFLGVHYPLDVIGGYTAAALWLTVVKWQGATDA